MKQLVIVFFLIVISPLFAQETPAIKELKIKLKKQSKEDTATVNTLNNLAWEYSFTDYAVSSDYCRKAITLSNKLNFDNGRAEAYNVLGNNARASSQYDSAFYFLGQALKIRQQQGKKEKVAAVLINIANIYYQQKDYAGAILKYNEAIQMSESIHFIKGELVALTN